MHAEQKKGTLFLPAIMLLTAGTAYFFCIFHRFSLGVISADLAAEFFLDPVKLGLLGSAYFYSYAFMQVPSGFLTDKLGPRIIMALSCFLTATAVLWFSFATGFPGLLASRTITGFAVAFIYVPSLAIIREWFDEKIYSTITGIFVAMGQLGSLGSSIPLDLAVGFLGWRSTFRILACVSMALLILVWFIVRSKPETRQGGKPGAGVWVSSKAAFKKPGFWSLMLFFFVYGGVLYSFQGLWGARFFDLALGRESERAALLMSLSVGCVAGGLLIGFLADRLGRFRVLTGCGFAMSLLWLSMACFGFASNGVVLYLLCFILGLLSSGGNAVAYTIVNYFSTTKNDLGNGGSENAGFLLGINGCAGFLGGAIFTQLAGVFFNFSKAGINSGFRVLFLVFVIACVFSTSLMLKLNKNLLKL